MILASFPIKKSCVSASVSPAICNTVDAFCLDIIRLDSPGEERTAMSLKSDLESSQQGIFAEAFSRQIADIDDTVQLNSTNVTYLSTTHQ